MTMQHAQRMFHIQGLEEGLDPHARKLLGGRLELNKSAFQALPFW